MLTKRQEITELLTEGEYGIRDISQIVGIREKEVYDHLGHIARSLKTRKRKLRLTPPRCIACNFRFKDRKKFNRPSKCPLCRNQRISEPRYRVV